MKDLVEELLGKWAGCGCGNWELRGKLGATVSSAVSLGATKTHN